MKKVISIIILVAAFVLQSCSTLNVSTDYDPAYDFGSLKSYKWIERADNDPINTIPLIAKRFNTAIGNELKTRGYQLSENDDADFLVTYTIITKDKLNIQDHGYYGTWRYGGRDISVTQYTEGTIILDFIDADKEELFWRGVGSSVLHSDSEGRDERIREAANQLMADFPPGYIAPEAK